MNPRRLSRANLVEFAVNAIAALMNDKITGLLPEQKAGLLAAFTDAADKLSSANGDVVDRRNAFHAGTAIARMRGDVVLNLFSSLKSTMDGLGAPDDQYEAVGFDPPARHSAVIPQSPTELAVKRTADGAIWLTFNGNNISGRVMYLVEAKIDGEYRLMGTTTKQRFKLENVIPGKPCRYRVYAQSAKRGRSGHSNETVV